MLVTQAIAGCSTGQIEGLSIQLLERLLEKGYLIKVSHPLIVAKGRQNFPYLQPLAATALYKAVKSRGVKLFINSCFRTIMQQFMLRQQYKRNWCGIRAAAIPGKSNHNSGLSLDIEDAQSWKPYLYKYGWRYLGDFDPMHFDFAPSSLSLRSQLVNLGILQVTEWQKLWNSYNKDDQLKVDGTWGNKTAGTIARSPVDGFGRTGTMKRGDYSQAVGEVQFLLRSKLGLATANLVADCHFGATTEKFVRMFQKQNGLAVDGFVGEKTLALLRA